MSKFDVRERDLGALRDVVAALRAPPGSVTPSPEACFGAPEALLTFDPAGLGVRWHALELLRDLLEAEDLMLQIHDPSSQSFCFGQEVDHLGPDDFWHTNMGPGGLPDTPNDVPADALELEARYWDNYGTIALHCSELADWGVVMASQDVPRRDLDERAARLEVPRRHILRTALRIDAGRHVSIEAVRPGRGSYSDRARGYLELLKPHVMQAFLTSCTPETPVTPAQRRVLELVRDGRTNRQVARDLGISEATVRTHLQNAYEALGVNNRVAAVAAVFDWPAAGGGTGRVPAQRDRAAPGEPAGFSG